MMSGTVVKRRVYEHRRPELSFRLRFCFELWHTDAQLSGHRCIFMHRTKRYQVHNTRAPLLLVLLEASLCTGHSNTTQFDRYRSHSQRRRAQCVR